MMKREIKLTKEQAIALIDKRLGAVLKYLDSKDFLEISKSLAELCANFNKNLIIDLKEKER